MIINISNYEAYALDYLEDNLPSVEAREMELFLAAHPAIAAELEEMRPLMTLTPDHSIVFEPKNLLLQPEKKAAIVWFQPQIRRRLAVAAAAILLLSAGYFVGFNNGLDTKEIQAENGTPIQEEQTDTPVNLVAQEAALEELETVKKSPVNTQVEEGKTTDYENTTAVRKQETRPVNYEITTPIVEKSLAQNETLNESTPQQVELLPIENANEDTTISIAQVTVLEQLPSLDLNSVQREILTEDSVLISNHGIVFQNRQQPKASKFLKGLIERMPFKELTANNFIPTYYSNNVGR